MIMGSSSGLATPLSAGDLIEEREFVASMLADLNGEEEDMEEDDNHADEETSVVALTVAEVAIVAAVREDVEMEEG